MAPRKRSWRASFIFADELANKCGRQENTKAKAGVELVNNGSTESVVLVTERGNEVKIVRPPDHEELNLV